MCASAGIGKSDTGETILPSRCLIITIRIFKRIKRASCQMLELTVTLVSRLQAIL